MTIEELLQIVDGEAMAAEAAIGGCEELQFLFHQSSVYVRSIQQFRGVGIEGAGRCEKSHPGQIQETGEFQGGDLGLRKFIREGY